jgi:hypothetical protein
MKTNNLKKIVENLSMVTLVVGTLASMGCSPGIIDAPDLEVASFELVADHLGALQMVKCVDNLNASVCPRYPNPSECTSMKVAIYGDASFSGFCRTKQDTVISTRGLEVPVECQAEIEGADICVSCIDVFGQTILRACQGDDGIEYFPDDGSEGQTPEDPDQETGSPDYQEPEPTGNQGTEPTDNNEPSDPCDPTNVLYLFADKVNDILAAEGIDISYQPNLDIADMAGFAGSLGMEVCERAQEDHDRLQDSRPIESYCEDDPFSGLVCRCGRMGTDAVIEVCQELEGICDSGAWQAALWMEMGMVTLRLSAPSYDLDLSDLLTPPSDGEEVPPSEEPESHEGETTNPNQEPDNPGEEDTGIICTGSPLVLDLEGDGIQPTSVDQGVKFNLLGQGILNTAWITGDDALLVLDRNKNGRIDDGSELFGEAIGLDNTFTKDGFKALALVDSRSHGGNADGVVDASDKLFTDLRVWNDWNQDAISQTEELSTLAQAGITALHLSSSYVPNSIDSFGNNLGLQGSFLRKDGSLGSMIDVFFSIKSVVVDLVAMR